MSFNYSFLPNLSLYNLNRPAIQLGFKTDFWTKDKHHKYIGKFRNPDVQIKSKMKNIMEIYTRLFVHSHNSLFYRPF